MESDLEKLAARRGTDLDGQGRLSLNLDNTCIEDLTGKPTHLIQSLLLSHDAEEEEKVAKRSGITAQINKSGLLNKSQSADSEMEDEVD